MKRVLLTTTYRRGKHNDFFMDDTRRSIFKYSWPMKISFGLRFIKHNIPQIEILEYPTWREYLNKLKEGWDIVGFSFYLRELPLVIKMIEFARKQGIKEIWGGNYGVLTPGMEKHFDKTFIGYAEHEIAKELGVEIGEIEHPPLMTYISVFGLKVVPLAVLFTTRGCPFNCAFCQAPHFSSNKLSKIPVKSIEKVLISYKRMGFSDLVILDENFGVDENQTRKITSLLKKYNFYWIAMTRAEILKKHLNEWNERGMVGVITGIESLSQENLDSINKSSSSEDSKELLKNLNSKNIFITGFYIIGFEKDTEKSIKNDIENLKRMKIDISRVYILTPFPKTDLIKRLESKYGVFDKNHCHYDGRNLIWNHPHIKPDEMVNIQKWSFRMLQTKNVFFRTGIKFFKNYRRNMSVPASIIHIVKKVITANINNY